MRAQQQAALAARRHVSDDRFTVNPYVETGELPLKQIGAIEYGDCKSMEVTENIDEASLAAQRAPQIPS
ncbi:hypothetical protein D3C83_03720 [compost metagenome]